jgi:hypothetical protein
MNDDGPASMKRRGFLQKATVAAGAASVSVPGLAAARGRPSRRKAVLDDRQVRALLDELGDVPLQRGRARTATASFGTGDHTVTAIPSHLGTLVHETFLSENPDIGTERAFFFFGGAKENGRIPPGHRKRLPKQYRNLPGEDQAVLGLNADGQPELYRAPRGSARPQTSVTGEIGARNHWPIPPEYDDFVKRQNVFERTIGQCRAYSSHEHSYRGVSFELTKPLNAIGTGSITAYIGYLAGSLLAGLAAGAVGALIGLAAQGSEYTIGLREYDISAFGWTQTMFASVASNEYNGDAHHATPFGTDPGHPYRVR